MAVLETVGADLHRQDKIADEDLVGAQRRIDRCPANSRAPPAAGSRRCAALPACRSSGIRARICATASASIGPVRRDRSQSAPRKPRKSGAKGKSRGMSGASSDPLRPDRQARATWRGRRKPGCAPAANGRAAAPSPCPRYRPSLHGSHASAKTGSKLEIRRQIGEQHGNQFRPRRKRRERRRAGRGISRTGRTRS